MQDISKFGLKTRKRVVKIWTYAETLCVVVESGFRHVELEAVGKQRTTTASALLRKRGHAIEIF